MPTWGSKVEESHPEGARLRASIVVPTYNRAKLLGYTLESLARQSVPKSEFEVIVADDGSSDESRAVAASFSSAMQVQYRYQTDQGYRVAAARNLGLEVAGGRVTVFLDAGVVATPHLLREHLREHEQAPGPLATIGCVFGFNQDNVHGEELVGLIDLDQTERTTDRLQADPRHRDLRDRAFLRYGDDLASLPAPWCLFWTCNAAVSTEAARRVGGFDENFRSWGVEDVEFAYRLHRRGVPFHLVRQGAGIHYPHPKTFAANMESLDRNCDYFYEKFPEHEISLFRTKNPLEINDILLAERAG